jgi:hypothetical protein
MFESVTPATATSTGIQLHRPPAENPLEKREGACVASIMLITVAVDRRPGQFILPSVTGARQHATVLFPGGTWVVVLVESNHPRPLLLCSLRLT